MIPEPKAAVPVGRLTRGEDAYTRLKSEVLDNRLPAGSTFSEPEIAMRLNMSRTPVREALVRLESEGLVRLVPRRGAYILPVDADDMREIYEILTAIEPHAALALARRRPSKAALAPLFDAQEAMEQALARDDLEAWSLADDRFHRCLLDLHGNRRLLGIAQSLYDQAHRARMVTLRLRARPEKSTREHRCILNGLHDGNTRCVFDTFLEHRRRAAAEMLDILKTYRLPPL